MAMATSNSNKKKKAYDYCSMNAHSPVDFNHVE